MPITDSKKTPDRPDERKDRDIMVVYIENTRGIWIRTNLINNQIELWFDGMFRASWNVPAKVNGDTIDADIACVMMAECLDIGKRIRSQEIKALIG